MREQPPSRWPQGRAPRWPQESGKGQTEADNDGHGLLGQEPSLTTDEARGLENFFLLLLLTAQVGKGVDDHPKDEVQHDDDDNEEEQKVIDHAGREERLLRGEGREAGVSSPHRKGIRASGSQGPEDGREDPASPHTMRITIRGPECG